VKRSKRKGKQEEKKEKKNEGKKKEKKKERKKQKDTFALNDELLITRVRKRKSRSRVIMTHFSES